MKKWIIRIALLLFYCVPYVFLAMNGDATSGTMLFYGLMIVAFYLLCFISKKTDNKNIVIVGNICSVISSLVFRNTFRTEKWDWYFKPLTDVELLIVVSAIAFIIQMIIAFKHKSK